MTLLLAKEWESPSGKVYCNHPVLVKYENPFKAFELIWGKSPIELMLFLEERYKADTVLMKNEDGSIKGYYFSWSDYGKAHRFALDTNNTARGKGITVESFLKLIA